MSEIVLKLLEYIKKSTDTAFYITIATIWFAICINFYFLNEKLQRIESFNIYLINKVNEIDENTKYPK